MVIKHNTQLILHFSSFISTAKGTMSVVSNEAMLFILFTALWPFLKFFSLVQVVIRFKDTTSPDPSSIKVLRFFGTTTLLIVFPWHVWLHCFVCLLLFLVEQIKYICLLNIRYLFKIIFVIYSSDRLKYKLSKIQSLPLTKRFFEAKLIESSEQEHDRWLVPTTLSFKTWMVSDFTIFSIYFLF